MAGVVPCAGRFDHGFPGPLAERGPHWQVADPARPTLGPVVERAFAAPGPGQITTIKSRKSI